MAGACKQGGGGGGGGWMRPLTDGGNNGLRDTRGRATGQPILGDGHGSGRRIRRCGDGNGLALVLRTRSDGQARAGSRASSKRYASNQAEAREAWQRRPSHAMRSGLALPQRHAGVGPQVRASRTRNDAEPEP